LWHYSLYGFVNNTKGCANASFRTKIHRLLAIAFRATIWMEKERGGEEKGKFIFL
jgi:hypothetical protein